MGILSQDERTAIVAKAVAAANAKAEPERIQLQWRSRDLVAPVVELPVNAVVLNPNSHRIRAQLESSPARQLVLSDPFGQVAQDAIEELLRQADEYVGLRDNLRDVGQSEPGVVTATGLLVNANTRCVALRDIGAGYIRAAVLPADASQEEIDRLELRLQMKKDFQSDYSFTNELLFIEDLIKKYHYSPEKIALEMGWASRSDASGLKAKTEQTRKYVRMLALLREVQAISIGQVPIIIFDSNRQAVMEIDEDVEKLKQSDANAAQSIRETRLAALLAGVGYRELREIAPDFVESYLVPSMEDRPGLQPFIDALTKVEPVSVDKMPPGLDVLGFSPAPDLSYARRSAAPILELLAKTNGQDSVVIRSSDGVDQTVPRSLFRDEFRVAVEGAAEDVRLNKKFGDSLQRPIELVRRAGKQVRTAIEAYIEVKAHPEFDSDRMRAAFADLSSALSSLATEIERESESE